MLTLIIIFTTVKLRRTIKLRLSPVVARRNFRLASRQQVNRDIPVN